MIAIGPSKDVLWSGYWSVVDIIWLIEKSKLQFKF